MRKEKRARMMTKTTTYQSLMREIKKRRKRKRKKSNSLNLLKSSIPIETMKDAHT